MSLPPADFVSLVKDALEHLYDPAHLTDHALAAALLPGPLPPGVSTAQALRQTLVDAVERLNPGPLLPADARQRRAHRILELRYVEALPFREVMTGLALSQTQYHREQRHALEAVATLLWEGAGKPRPGQAGAGSAPEPVLHEVEAATHDGERLVDLHEVVRGVLGMLRQVAAARGVELREELAPGRAMVRGSRTALRQITISLVLYLLGGAVGGRLVVASREREGSLLLGVAYQGVLRGPELEMPGARERLAIAERLAEAMGGVLAVDEGPDGAALAVALKTHRRSLLIVDDNPDMVQLISRLVADQDYDVLSAGSVQEGLGLARGNSPDVILLDIMIPEQDGWDALQALKHDPATQDIPVLVCTVLGESELALALGASEFIRKPLTRPGLLAALDRWTTRLPRREAESPGSSARREASD